MIQSILDNDLYKFTMQQAVYLLYPTVEVQYELINRGATPFPDGFAQKVQNEIFKMSDFTLSAKQKSFLEEKCPFFTAEYLEYLRSYKYTSDEVIIDQEGSDLAVRITGQWVNTILWEVPLMAIISEVYFKMSGHRPVSKLQRQKNNLNKAKIFTTNGIKFADFGTRRRFSAANHEQVIIDLASQAEHNLLGTSNVHFAQQFDITPVGTVAHEWFMFHGALHGYQQGNPSALKTWFDIFQGNLGIALTDTYTTNFFLSTFSHDDAKRYAGVRHDSGDPFTFIDKIVQHYKRLDIAPLTKTIVFSDGLNAEKAVQIHQHCKDRIQDVYGIGTTLTNDIGCSPLNMVIKMRKCRNSVDAPWRHTVKISDDRGKHTGDQEELQICLRAIQD